MGRAADSRGVAGDVAVVDDERAGALGHVNVLGEASGAVGGGGVGEGRAGGGGVGEVVPVEGSEAGAVVEAELGIEDIVEHCCVDKLLLC